MSVLTISLSGRSAKEVTRLLANDTARRVMDAVADESKSESQLAKELDIPLSTVHYNVQKLFDAGLLKSEEFTYSEKGKEVRHYQLASEHIVISTKPVVPAAELISGGLAAVLLAAGFALFSHSVDEPVAMRAMDSAAEGVALTAPVASSAPVVWPFI